MLLVSITRRDDGTREQFAICLCTEVENPRRTVKKAPTPSVLSRASVCHPETPLAATKDLRIPSCMEILRRFAPQNDTWCLSRAILRRSEAENPWRTVKKTNQRHRFCPAPRRVILRSHLRRRRIFEYHPAWRFFVALLLRMTHGACRARSSAEAKRRPLGAPSKNEPMPSVLSGISACHPETPLAATKDLRLTSDMEILRRFCSSE